MKRRKFLPYVSRDWEALSDYHVFTYLHSSKLIIPSWFVSTSEKNLSSLALGMNRPAAVNADLSSPLSNWPL